MITPGRGYDNSRLAQLEAIVLDLQLRLTASRDARPFSNQRGIHRVVTIDAISRATPGTVKLVYWNGAAYAAALDASDVEITVECRGYMLQTGETVVADAAGFAQHLDDGTWEWLSGNCAARDWLLSGES